MSDQQPQPAEPAEPQPAGPGPVEPQERTQHRDPTVGERADPTLVDPRDQLPPR